MKFFVATIISRIFDPPVILTILTILAVYKSGATGLSVWVLVALMVAVPVLYFIHELRTHKISNIDVSNRKERIRPLIIFASCIFIDIILISFFNNNFLLHVFELYLLWILGFLVITIFWKISGHSGISTLAYFLLLQWFGPILWPLVFVVFLVSWARVVRHDHTLSQVAAGIIYSLSIVGLWTIIAK
jgi:membrane-associated phospholipid phosphatase